MKALLLAFGLCISANAQINGTIVVMELTKDGLFVAADSRATFQQAPPEDNHCKIATIGPDAIFTATGASAYPAVPDDKVKPWSVVSEAKRAASTIRKRHIHDIRIAVVEIANIWTKRMENNWNAIKLAHPEKVKEAEERGKGMLSNGFFAIGRNGNLVAVARSIKSSNSVISSEVLPIDKMCPINVPCASGETDIFTEFGKRTSERAKAERLPDSPKLKVIRLVELTIAYDKTHNTGGPIDAVQLTPQGKIVWFQRKPSCPDNKQ